jgi:hypothetical protein
VLAVICPDCEEPVRIEATSEESEECAVCEHCLAILRVDPKTGKLIFLDYNQLDLSTRAMLVAGINMMLSQHAICYLGDMLVEKRKGGDA